MTFFNVCFRNGSIHCSYEMYFSPLLLSATDKAELRLSWIFEWPAHIQSDFGASSQYYFFNNFLNHSSTLQSFNRNKKQKMTIRTHRGSKAQCTSYESVTLVTAPRGDRLDAPCVTRSHDPRIKSIMLYWLSWLMHIDQFQWISSFMSWSSCLSNGSVKWRMVTVSIPARNAWFIDFNWKYGMTLGSTSIQMDIRMCITA